MILLPKIYPVTCHTDHVGPNSTFVAIKGYAQDGTVYIKKAIELGATKIILDDKNLKKEDFCSKDKNIDFIYVQNSRIALAQYSAQSLNFPANKLKIIGITGTKGKTTTTFIIEHILKSAGFKTALLGTVKNKILDKEIESERTTPQADYLQMFFAECVNNKIDYVVMEISSHALSLDRTYGLNFDAVGFTNLAPEHLDFYKDMQDYFDAKYMIFNQVKPNGSAVINIDNSWGQEAVKRLASEKIKNLNAFGLQENLNNKNNKFIIKNNSLNGLEIELDNDNFIAPNLFGEFNAYNLVMSKIICQNLGLDKTVVNNAIKNFSGTPGRLQVHRLKNGATAFVDYAHNPSSMEAVLKTLRPLTDNLIVIFGCGGDRDRTKRPVMGSLATQYGDYVIISDDNPRTEDHNFIAQEILSGIKDQDKNKTKLELDRKKAIEIAAEISKPNSVIALLGKGHENYYLVGTQKFHFDDLEEISKF